MTKGIKQLDKLSDKDKKNLYDLIRRFLDYKWEKNVKLSNVNPTYKDYDHEGGSELRELKKHRFIKKVAGPKDGWNYELNEVDWWGLFGFDYKFFIDTKLDKTEFYGDKNQGEVIYKIAKKKSEKKGRLDIKITQQDFGKNLPFTNLIYALKEAEKQKWLRVEDLNISFPERIYGGKEIKFELFLQVFKQKDSAQPKQVEPIILKEGSKWEDITIKFKNEYDVEIQVRDKVYPSNYEDMGFADDRKNQEKLTKAVESWKLLHLFAINEGVFPLNSLLPKDREQRTKQKQGIKKKLKEKFPTVAGTPIEDLNEREEYTININLIPETEFRDDFEDARKKITDDSTNFR